MSPLLFSTFCHSISLGVYSASSMVIEKTDYLVAMDFEDRIEHFSGTYIHFCTSGFNDS